MIGASVTRTGNNQAIRDVIVRLGRKLPAALQAAAEVVFKESQELCPTDTGYLKETGEITTEGSGVHTVKKIQYGNGRFPPQMRRSKKLGKEVVRYPYWYARPVHDRNDAVGFDWLNTAIRSKAIEAAAAFKQVIRS
jgi:hypothetical protein